MNKLLIISGPTAVGKTKLALHLAKLFGGELISADSRQVYKQMDIGTGKEYSADIPIWGYDLVFPNEEWNAARFVKFATRVIADILRRGKLPIVVGGTGLYIKNLLYPPKTLFVPPDKKLREKLQKMTVSELQAELQRVNLKRFGDMNESDRKNPRRLVRAIEIATWSSRASAESVAISKQIAMFPSTAAQAFGSEDFDGELSRTARVRRGPRNDILHIAVTAPLDTLDKRITKRVNQRLDQGVEQEVRRLAKRYGWDSALSYTIAYQEWKLYFEGEKTREDIITLWTTHERQYARRQLTWLRKQPNLQWFDIANPKCPQTVVSVVRQWYDGIQHGR